MTKPPLVNQSSKLPTRKLTIGTSITAAVTAAWVPVMTAVFPPLATAEVASAAGLVLGLLIGYVVKDRANV